jgi:hypothetical protein
MMRKGPSGGSSELLREARDSHLAHGLGPESGRG